MILIECMRREIRTHKLNGRSDIENKQTKIKKLDKMKFSNHTRENSHA